MKKDFLVVSIIGLSLLCTTMFLTMTKSIYADTEIYNNSHEIFCDEYGSCLNTVLTQKEYEAGETIDISFVATDFVIQDVSYTYDGFNLLSEPIINRIIG